MGLFALGRGSSAPHSSVPNGERCCARRGNPTGCHHACDREDQGRTCREHRNVRRCCRCGGPCLSHRQVVVMHADRNSQTYGAKRMQVIETSVVRAQDLDISIVVPVFNEEESIPYLCERLFGILEQQRYLFEVIIVNDGSTDRSLERL